MMFYAYTLRHATPYIVSIRYCHFAAALLPDAAAMLLMREIIQHNNGTEALHNNGV